MSQKKKKAPEAQELIDSLLDESTPAHGQSTAASVRLSVDDRSFASRNSSRDVSPSSRSVHTENDETVPLPALSTRTAEKPSLRLDEETSTSPVVDPEQFEETAGGFDPSSSHDNTLPLKARAKVKPPEPSDFTRPNPTLSRHAATDAGGDSTINERSAAGPSRVDRLGITELKTVVKMRGAAATSESPRPQKQSAGPGPSFSSAEASLKQSESLRIAQARINELEHELERIRRENEQLSTAGETLRRRTDELLSRSENLELNARESERIHDEEKKVFRGQLQSKDREILELRNRNEEMEGRLESNFKKIRVRERELEHRLEIVKMESQTLIAGKDKMILDLKRQIDTLTQENDYGKQKTQELFNQYKEKQETVRRVVRALRIALTVLEGDEDAGGMKKAE